MKSKSDRHSLIRGLPNSIIPTEKKIKAKTLKATDSEKSIQAMAENLCIKLGIRYFRIPDKLLGFLATSAPLWTRVFVARYFSGVPDLMLFRATADGKNEVLFIEIKTEAGKLSQGQLKWHSGLNVKVCYGWAETEMVILRFNAELEEECEIKHYKEINK